MGNRFAPRYRDRNTITATLHDTTAATSTPPGTSPASPTPLAHAPVLSVTAEHTNHSHNPNTCIDLKTEWDYFRNLDIIKVFLLKL